MVRPGKDGRVVGRAIFAGVLLVGTPFYALWVILGRLVAS